MESIIELLKGWGGWVAAAIASIFVIRWSIKFDVNQWLKDRREVKHEKARMLCPHANTGKDDLGRPIVRSQFTSPPGTRDYLICELCGTMVYSQESVDEKTRYWAKNIKELEQRLEEFGKAVRKLH